jgi:hypothetical protein
MPDPVGRYLKRPDLRQKGCRVLAAHRRLQAGLGRPFLKRRGNPTADETTLVHDVARRLRSALLHRPTNRHGDAGDDRRRPAQAPTG